MPVAVLRRRAVVIQRVEGARIVAPSVVPFSSIQTRVDIPAMVLVNSYPVTNIELRIDALIDGRNETGVCEAKPNALYICSVTAPKRVGVARIYFSGVESPATVWLVRVESLDEAIIGLLTSILGEVSMVG